MKKKKEEHAFVIGVEDDGNTQDGRRYRKAEVVFLSTDEKVNEKFKLGSAIMVDVMGMTPIQFEDEDFFVINPNDVVALIKEDK